MPFGIGAGKKTEVQGLKELEAKLLSVMTDFRGEKARKVVGQAATEVRRDVAAAIMAVPSPRTITGKKRSVGPSRVLQALFSYNRQPPGSNKRILTALVGIKKGLSRGKRGAAYFEWIAGRLGPRSSSRAKVPAGEMVGESLATMWELGTTRRPATPFFRPAVQGGRSRIVQTIAAGYRAILEKYVK